MCQEVEGSMVKGSVGFFTPNIPRLEVISYGEITYLLTCWDIQVTMINQGCKKGNVKITSFPVDYGILSYPWREGWSKEKKARLHRLCNRHTNIQPKSRTQKWSILAITVLKIFRIFGHFHGATSGKNCHPFRGVQTPLLWRRDVLEFIAHALHAEALTLHLTHREEVRNDTILTILQSREEEIYRHLTPLTLHLEMIHQFIMSCSPCIGVVSLSSSLVCFGLQHINSSHGHERYSRSELRERSLKQQKDTAYTEILLECAGYLLVFQKISMSSSCSYCCIGNKLSDISHHCPSCEPYDLDGSFEIPKIKNQPPGMMG